MPQRQHWPAADKKLDFDRRLDTAAKDAARLIRSSPDPLFVLSRFLILVGDSVQSARPPASSQRRTA